MRIPHHIRTFTWTYMWRFAAIAAAMIWWRTNGVDTDSAAEWFISNMLIVLLVVAWTWNADGAPAVWTRWRARRDPMRPTGPSVTELEDAPMLATWREMTTVDLEPKLVAEFDQMAATVRRLAAEQGLDLSDERTAWAVSWAAVTVDALNEQRRAAWGSVIAVTAREAVRDA